MVRFYCDRCGKDITNTNSKRIRTPVVETEDGFKANVEEVCPECEREYNELMLKLKKIRIILFEGFMDKYKTEVKPNE